jgi:ornithine carbamoyltransferase
MTQVRDVDSIPRVPGVPDTLKGRSLTRIAAWSRDELATLLDLADELKAERARRRELRVLPGRTIGLIFHKPSTRTRVAFEVGIAELGGMALFLPAAELQLARGESYRDTALVLSRFLSALMIRTFEQEEVEEFAEHAAIPVINGLTDESHPLQALADAMTLRERFGSLSGLRVAYVGDGNNVCHSLMRIGGRFGMRFVAATPATYEPRADFVASAAEDALANGGSVELVTDPREAVRGAAAVYTDVWTSMGQEEARDRRLRDLEPYRIDDALLALADREAVAMHCLPAHVGEEISAEVLYGPRCLAWEQAENRLHTQKALMALVIR